MVPSKDEAILSVRGLTKSFGNLTAVTDLSLEIRKGEIFGFLGPNGAGKTTAISMICGLLKEDSGEVMIKGRHLSDNYRALKHMVGLCPQEIVIWEDLTCLEQLEMTGRLYDVQRKAAQKKALELLDILGLTEKRNKRAKTLSGGMKRRLNIALALVHEPEILILDEPQAGLDPQSRVLVRDYIRSLAENITVILTTHDMDEADRLSDRVAIIDYGRLLVLDTPEKLKNQVGKGDILEIKIVPGQDEKVYIFLAKLPGNLRHIMHHETNTLQLIGSGIMDSLPSLLERFKKSRLEIEDMMLRKKTLEDVFISLTGRRLRE
jgi:ABC-2 type transport system ATP-binding protein